MAVDETPRDAEAPEPVAPRDSPLPEPVDQPGPAETAEQPGPAETAEQPSLAETSEHPELPGAVEGTVVEGGEAQAQPPPTQRWSARAQVPQRDVEEPMPTEEWEALRGSQSGIMVPALVFICALLLLALIGLGVWLILRNRDGGPIPPAPTASATATTGAPTTAPPTTAPPTTAPPTTAPPTTAPPLVAIPPVGGLDYDTAAGRLSDLRLVPQKREEASTEVEAGTVIGTEPGPGSQVEPGSTVIVIVSIGPPTAEPTSPAPSPS